MHLKQEKHDNDNHMTHNVSTDQQFEKNKDTMVTGQQNQRGRELIATKDPKKIQRRGKELLLSNSNQREQFWVLINLCLLMK